MEILFNNNDKPIVARATPAGQSAIAVIRCSGQGILQLLDGLFRGKQPLLKSTSRTQILGWMVDPHSGEKIDQVMVSLFPGPKSYTGEDMAEISTHGGNFVCQSVIGLLLRQGCRSARPGEFTRRAFLHGKMNLLKAEAISEIIRARTDEQRKMALSQMDPNAILPFTELKAALEDCLMMVESKIEFPEENLHGKGDLKDLIPVLENNLKKMSELCCAFDRGKKIREGLLIPIVGIPNAGKSSLFNWFCKSERVIVDSEPGTTRDLVEEELDIDGEKIRLVDTAGIRENADLVEKKGIEKTREQMEKADAVLIVHDATSLKCEEKITEKLKGKKIFHLYNKIDLLGKNAKCPDYGISLKTGEGLENFLHDFRKEIKNLVGTGLPVYSVHAFQKECLDHAKEKLMETLERYHTGEARSEETISIEIRDILQTLEPLLGKISSEEVLNRIFDSFCIGK